MRVYCCAFVVGILLVCHAAPVPRYVLIGMLLGATLASAKWSSFRPLIVMTLAVFYAQWRADLVVESQLPASLSGEVFWLAGTVSALSLANEKPDFNRQQIFVLQARAAETLRGQDLPFKRVRLSTYSPLELRLHTSCQFYVRLKMPWGVSNPGGFDQRRWQFMERIDAVGYVIDHPKNRCDHDAPVSWFSEQRHSLLGAIDRALPTGPSRAVIKALGLAERDQITDQQWSILAVTGTTHLLAISGLHIALVAGFVFYVSRLLGAAIFPHRRRFAIYQFAAVMSILAATFYAGLAQFSVPTQRALIMVSIGAAAIIVRRRPWSGHTLLLSAAAIVLMDPFAPLNLGFWLSFSAVAILISLQARAGPERRLKRVWRVHCYLALGLLPLLVSINSQVPISSPVANLIAVPIVGLAVVPLVVLGLGSELLGFPFASALWGFAAQVWNVLWQFLVYLADVSPRLTASSHISGVQFVVASLGIVLMLVPLVKRPWWFILPCLASLLIDTRQRLGPGEFRLSVLDVGQGLAVVVQTANRALIYDTGPSFGTYSAGSRIVAPAANALGVRQVDLLILSHLDNDHAGGAAALLQALPVAKVMTSQPNFSLAPASQCVRGMSWNWDAVSFEILSPSATVSGSENDLSCVLRINGLFGSALLAGDIEYKSELTLVHKFASSLQADILVAPHHGSLSSSSKAFIAAVSPIQVVFSAGYQNRFQFPARQVVARYQSISATTHTTWQSGALIFNVRKVGLSLAHTRDASNRYWRRHWNNG